MKKVFTGSIWQEEEWVIAQCAEVDVASQGKSEEEALENLREALKLYFESPRATAAPQTRTIEVEIVAA